MEAALRFGDPESARRYPLPATAASAGFWQTREGAVSASIPVPSCPRDHLIVPSVCLHRQPRSFQCALAIEGATWPLRAVASAAAGESNPSSTGIDDLPLLEPTGDREVSTHIDCLHTEQDLPPSHLLIRLAGPTPPDAFLVTLTIRPLQIAPDFPASPRLVLPQPPPISQMQGPAPIRKRICSPTALAMILKAERPEIRWESVVKACFDGRFYGAWPLAIQCAGAHGRVCAVEAVSSWKPVLSVLHTGQPVVASIRFGAGKLPGAPLRQSGGHLVTVYGIDGDQVLVNDPAAEDAATVPRSYDLRAFANAWLRHRGAAYFLAPP